LQRVLGPGERRPPTGSWAILIDSLSMWGRAAEAEGDLDAKRVYWARYENAQGQTWETRNPGDRSCQAEAAARAGAGCATATDEEQRSGESPASHGYKHSSASRRGADAVRRQRQRLVWAACGRRGAPRMERAPRLPGSLASPRRRA
jgi:hypothetical protein